MIDLLQTRSQSTRQIWSGTAQQLFRSLDLEDRPATPEISESIAAFCEQHPHMPQHAFALLAARCFLMIDDDDAAIRILQDNRQHRRYLETWITALASSKSFPKLFPLFLSRALRPLSLTSAPDSQTWLLDFEKVRLTASDRHELLLYLTLRTLIENVSNVWNSTEGEGVLVIKGLPRMGRWLHINSSAEFLDYIRDTLSCCSQENGWIATPSILLLDV